jgi:hypothetical protein
LQYNFVGHRRSPLPLFSALTIQFAAGRIRRGGRFNESTAIYYRLVLAFVERCDTLSFLELS